MAGSTPPLGLTIVPWQVDGQQARGRPKRIPDPRIRTPTGRLPKVRSACNACRDKKTRCSGHMPCIRCRKYGETCEYMPKASDPPVDVTGEVGRSSLDTARGSADVSGHQEDESGSPLLNEGTIEDTVQQDQFGHYHGGTSEFAYLQYTKQKLASIPSMSIYFVDSPFPKLEESDWILPPKPIADELMHSYFDFGLTTTRFVHEPSMRQIYETFYGHLDARKELGSDVIALLYMVFALGAHYSKLENLFCGYNSSVRFFEMGMKQLDKDPSRITLATLQTRLLAIHFLIHHSRLHQAWSTFGTLVRHAQALGIHRHSIGPPTDYIAHVFRKRIFWTMYINDRQLSSLFGRPCAIHDDDIDQEECEFADDDGITVSGIIHTPKDQFCAAAALIYYSRVARILGKILRELYSPAARLRPISKLYKSAMELENELCEWKANLPPYLDFFLIPQSALSVLMRRQLATIKTMYAHTSLLLYRPFILYSLETNAIRQPSLDQWVEKCHDKSISAAKMVISECHFLLQKGMFSRIFFMNNYIQFASIGTLLLYTHFWPGKYDIREIADRALSELPIGVDGDPLGQRFLEVLHELHDLTGGATGTEVVPLPPEQDGLAQPGVADCNAVSEFANLQVQGQIGGENVASLDNLWADLSGPWTTLFFDSTAYDGYVGGDPGVGGMS
ncbi:unnamed protein product [Clonostachys rosea]|uniref:Zn(2)-C6 fungal-type domain-containing protein n=1 Tax=Bionectria ochroleuca TaxID=29856 RepID=A0ABY6V1Y1_BIOOC|nr:unnamed protein product [Clonostachys rosea]